MNEWDELIYLKIYIEFIRYILLSIIIELKDKIL